MLQWRDGISIPGNCGAEIYKGVYVLQLLVSQQHFPQGRLVLLYLQFGNDAVSYGTLAAWLFSGHILLAPSSLVYSETMIRRVRHTAVDTLELEGLIRW